MALSSLRVFIEEWFLRDLRRAEEQSRGWRSQVSSTTMMQARTSADDRAKCKKQNHAAKIQFITSLQEGQSWQTSATKAGLQISQSSAYRLWGAFRHRGETGALRWAAWSSQQAPWGCTSLLKRFNDRALNRNLEELCANVAKAAALLPDGRCLLFRVQGASLPCLDAQERAVA